MATKQGFLSRVIGHLAVEERTDEFAQLQDLLSRSAFPEETRDLAGGMFSFEGADLFSPERVARVQSEAIEKLAQTSARPSTGYSLGKSPCGARSCTARIHLGRVAQLRSEVSDHS